MSEGGEAEQDVLEDLPAGRVEAAVGLLGENEEDPLDAADRLVRSYREGPALAALPQPHQGRLQQGEAAWLLVQVLQQQVDERGLN